MEAELELELKKLIVGTNDQRRRVGQALYHFYRTLVFWRDKGMSFGDVARSWAAGGAAIFDTLAATLRQVGPQEEDGDLRAFLVRFLDRLAGDLERGDHVMVSFLRWLEGRFPEVTAMMRSEDAASRIYDIELAELLARTFTHLARADRESGIEVLRAARDAIARASTGP